MSAADRITELGNILQTCVEGKEAIADALTSKGVATKPEDSFDTMAVNVGLIEGGAVVNQWTYLGEITADEPQIISFPLERKVTEILILGKGMTGQSAIRIYFAYGNGDHLAAQAVTNTKYTAFTFHAVSVCDEIINLSSLWNSVLSYTQSDTPQTEYSYLEGGSYILRRPYTPALPTEIKVSGLYAGKISGSVKCYVKYA